MTTKRCTSCCEHGERLPIDRFDARTHASGNVGWSSQCRECRLAHKRKHSREVYVKRGKGMSIPWKTVSSPVDDLGYPLWTLGGRFTALDVKLTLGNGYFSPGMIFRHNKDGDFVVVGEGEGQELERC